MSHNTCADVEIMDSDNLQISFVDGNHFTTLESWSILLNVVLLAILVALL